MKFDTIGERICYCRNLLNLSQRDFAEQFEISKPTITRWESNEVKITDSRLKALAESFGKYGILVDVNWLSHGGGNPPINQNAAPLDLYNFDEITYLTLNELKLKIKNFEIYQLTSKFFEPILSYADYVAGVASDEKSFLNGKLCFVITSKDVLVGVYDFIERTIKNFFGKTIDVKNALIIGEVLWSAKRF